LRLCARHFWLRVSALDIDDDWVRISSERE
jgi:hypothetical protein